MPTTARSICWRAPCRTPAAAACGTGRAPSRRACFCGSIAIGAVAPFSVLALPRLDALGWRRPTWAVLVAVVLVATAAGRIVAPGEPALDSLLRGLFVSNGLLVCAGVAV